MAWSSDTGAEMRVTLRRGDAVRFWQLSRREKLEWSRTVGAVALARAGLKAVSLRQLASAFGLVLCEDSAAAGLNSEPEVASVAAHVRGVLLRWPSRSHCLVAALAAGFLLRRQRPKLFIGVRRSGPSIAAHAWLDVDGGRVPISSPDDEQGFVPLRRSQVV